MPASTSTQHIHLYDSPWNCEVLEDGDGAWFMWNPQNLAQCLINGCASDEINKPMPDKLCYLNVKTVFVSTIHIL